MCANFWKSVHQTANVHKLFGTNSGDGRLMYPHTTSFIAAIVLSAFIGSPLCADEKSDLLFENNIRPVLVETCFRCHGDSKISGMLRIDSREALMQGGESGAAIVPGKPEESLLIMAIKRQADVSAMPPEKEKSLRPDQIAAFETWIRDGAHWPETAKTFEHQLYWAFQPVHDVSPPAVHDSRWVKNSLDAFIRSKQEAAGLDPAPRADKQTLIRRATFDLIGLPPTSEEVTAFVNDTSPDADEKLIERLLASPHYGERWGRHWLDVVRYADTAGETADYPVPLAWRYRNYVIDSFNADKPYDAFLREQIAGDILANQGPPERYAEQVTATGYLAISRRFGFDSENYHHLTIQDTIDTLGQSVLGLSLGCARCHDHKFDDVSMTDYYGLYGIFDSSRYSFPGSEQKQKFRSMAPLLAQKASIPRWRQFDQRVGAIAASLEQQKQGVPTAILRSLNDLDGDFELQAPAAGGSNGVLVPPWLYEGNIAVSNAAQSPYKNLYARGRVGASVSSGVNPYRIAQSLYPHRSRSNGGHVCVNLDFRVASTDASQSRAHRFWIGARPNSPAVTVQISSDVASLTIGDETTKIDTLKPSEWHNLQLKIDLELALVSGTVGIPGAVTAFENVPLGANWNGTIDFAALESSAESELTYPAIEFDNLSVQDSPIPAVSTEMHGALNAGGIDVAALTIELQDLTGTDGDFEAQIDDTQPATPWHPGPNSAVRLKKSSQSPFMNLFPTGELGIHMPNRGEYDGFGLTLPKTWNAAETEQLFACFDFRCSDVTAGGDGAWRFYVGHGPGNSAAVELFFNGKEFFRRSGDAKEHVCTINVGEWQHVQLKLDLKAKTFSGLIVSKTSQSEFTGDVAGGWDGMIDYSFIDSYGHIGGVRPALDVDNYEIREAAFPALDSAPVDVHATESASRRNRVREIRTLLASAQNDTARAVEELNSLLANGPFDMAYGMAEGTPHNVRMHRRGEPSQPGAEVPRGLIKALGGGPLPENTPGSGRLELAQWLTEPGNPLTARVMVNRIWQYHFGHGLVKTPNDFGVRGLPPTHPELLDYLATQFVRNDWSMKSMHRLIMLSATYQQSSIAKTSPATANAEMNASDFCTHFPRRRLSAEEIRDSILAVTGELDAEPGREHPFPSPISWGFSQHGPFNAVYDHNKRSIYLMTQRLKRHPFLALFDGADPNASTADRSGTTVPTQALYFLNDPFVHTKADSWASRLQAASAVESEQVDHACRTAFGRSASADELKDASEFLSVYRMELAAIGQDNIDRRALAAFLRTLIGSNEFLHVD